VTTTFPAQLPAIRNFAECEAWLKTVPVDDGAAACEAFIAMLGQLEDIPPRPLAYVDILECLREPARAAQADQTKKFAHAPQPLARDEVAAYDRVSDLGAAFARAYLALLRGHLDGDAPELQRRVAQLCQRSIDSVAEQMAAAWRARREIDPDLWRRLHETYRLAEAKGVTSEQVTLLRSAATTASAADLYARALLLHLAQPYGLTAREFLWLRRWASLWAGKVSLAVGLADATQGYAVNLEGETPPVWLRIESAAPGSRFLNARPLYRSVVNRLKKLHHGEAPAALGLGDDCEPAETLPLLQSFYRAWFEDPGPKASLRRSSTGTTEFVSGIAGIHALFGGDASGMQSWETICESASDFQLRCQNPEARLQLRQLAGLRPPGARAPILCVIESLMSTARGVLELGARALPGVARAVTARLADVAPLDERPAFFLPENATEPPTLVLADQAVQPRQIVGFALDDEVRMARIDAIVQRGHDFVRARVVLLNR